jgi:hypoxanthine phosphoribosyltransferase
MDVRKITYSASDIAQRVEEMGREITEWYPAGEGLLLLGLLKGSFIFMADIARHIARPLHVDFLVASSYGAGTVSSGDLRLLL